MMNRIIYLNNIIKKYFIKDTKYFFLYIFRYFQDSYKNNCLFLSKNDIKKLIEEGISLIRIGDGEIGLIHYLDIGYQKFSNDIRYDFLKIIKEYKDSSKYVLGIPIFVNYTNLELKNTKGLHNYFKCWMPLKVTYELIFNQRAKYFDAHIFYRDNGFKDVIEPVLKKKKNVLVTNDHNIRKISKLYLPFAISEYVSCAESNTYELRVEIKNKIIYSVNKIGNRRDVVVLMSAGLAKTIIFDLANDGYQIIDVGMGLEGYYEGVSLNDLI